MSKQFCILVKKQNMPAHALFCVTIAVTIVTI